MVSHKMEDQFRHLHETYMQMLYRTAFYLVGDADAAETIAGETWMEIFQDPSCRSKDILFELQAERLLVKQCASHDGAYGNYTASPPGSETEALLQGLSELCFSDRCCAVLAVICGYSPQKTAAILRRPLWLVNRQLHQVSEKFCRLYLEICC